MDTANHETESGPLRAGKRIPYFTPESRKLHNHLERQRRKSMAETIKDFVNVLPNDPRGRKDKTSILEAVVNFFDLVTKNVGNIRALEREFIRVESMTAELADYNSTGDQQYQQNSCDEPAAKYALVDIRAFDLLAALEADVRKRALLASNSSAPEDLTSLADLINKTREAGLNGVHSSESPVDPEPIPFLVEPDVTEPVEDQTRS